MNRENGKKRVLLSMLIIILVFCLTAIIIIGIIYAPKKTIRAGEFREMVLKTSAETATIPMAVPTEIIRAIQ